MTPSEVQARARRAKELLEHPIFQEVVEDLTARYLAEWRGSGLSASNLREERFAQVRALDGVKAELHRWIEDADHLARRQERAERKPAKWLA